MMINTSRGSFECKTVRETLAHLQSGEEIWISGNEPYPCLAVVINDDFAAVHYFENEDGAMWLSFNEKNDKEVTFIAGGEQWTPEAEAVITLDKAALCIKEFGTTYQRPSCIQWQEL
ncbi:MAG: hypothetical protein K2M46_07055 [Lachnospiraceae bacterium]|nr:hypothetical protein [Lachnospiraceae bacterium]